MVSGYQNMLGYNFVNLSNPYLKWEQVKQTNIGLDFNYKGLIEGSVDYYQKRTTRMFNDLQNHLLQVTIQSEEMTEFLITKVLKV
jgi:hypothetical protein